MSDPQLQVEILRQILDALGRIERRFSQITTPDDFLATDDGIDRLDSVCMMLIAIGESLKNLDRITGGSLLAQYPSVDWKGAKGMRDTISHHYFDLNAEAVFGICKNHLPAMWPCRSPIWDRWRWSVTSASGRSRWSGGSSMA